MNKNISNLEKNHIDQIKLTIRKRFESSSIILFPNLIKSEFYLTKIVWIGCFFLSASWCGWFISRSIFDYLNYNIVTRTLVKHRSGLIFPIVSICNINPFTTEYSNNFINSIVDINNLGLDSQYQSLLYANSLNTNKSRFDRKKFGFNLSEILFTCSFVSNSCNLNDDFEYYYDVNYGNCFRYNSGRNMHGNKTKQKYVYGRGINNALDLELYIGSANENQFPFSYENGMLIFVSNESLDSTYDEGIFVSPGTSTRIMLSSYSHKIESKPYSECTKELTSINSYDSDVFRKTFSLKEDIKYKYITCLKVCYQKFLGKICDCQTSYYNYYYYDNLRKCGIDVADYKTYFNDRNCDDQFWFNFTTDDTFIKECDCPLECEYSGYNYLISSTQYPTRIYVEKYLFKYYKDFFNSKLSKLDYIDIKDKIAKVSIFYNEMVHTEIIQDVKIEVADLVSNIGGIMSLFLGLSFLTIVELFELLIKIIDILIKQHFKETNF